MDKIEVKLMYNTPLDVLTHAIAKPYKKLEHWKSMSKEELYRKLVSITIDRKHESVLEHAVFTFDITGISRTCLMELTRHRIASYTVQSTRYTTPTGDDFVIPLDVDSNYKDKLNEQISNYLKAIQTLDFSRDFLKYFAPESLRTSLILTINLRSLRNLLKLRTGKQAHFEIKYLANKILDLMLESEYKSFFDDIKA